MFILPQERSLPTCFTDIGRMVCDPSSLLICIEFWHFLFVLFMSRGEGTDVTVTLVDAGCERAKLGVYVKALQLYCTV